MSDENVNVRPGAEAKPPAPTPESIANRLSVNENKERENVGGQSSMPTVKEPEAAQAPVFDLSKLTPEQLIGLKQALEAAPLRVAKLGNPIVKLRRIEGNIVLDFGNAYQTLVHDDLANMNIEKVIIPVKFIGANGKIDAAFTKVDYRDFMNAEQIKCEVISTRREVGGFSEGEVESNERPGVMVELRVNTMQDFFTVKLPPGSPTPQVEIEARIANA